MKLMYPPEYTSVFKQEGKKISSCENLPNWCRVLFLLISLYLIRFLITRHFKCSDKFNFFH